MPVLPKSYSHISCPEGIGVNGFDDVAIDNIKTSFKISPNYEEIYCIHDSSVEQEFLHNQLWIADYGNDVYDSWIYDGTEDERTVGHKYIQMYPYNVPVLKVGDYVCFDYYKNKTKSTWLTIALDSQTLYEQIAKIRMCTNEIRFRNESGVLLRVPCVFDDKVNSEKNVTMAKMKYINGITTILCQTNKDSEQLKPNQRLLFGRPGNWTAFRIVGIGVNNFMNTTFYDNNTATLLEITMEASYVNPDIDDIKNGIAGEEEFTINIEGGNISNVVGSTSDLYAVVRKNGTIVDSPVLWTSSNESSVSVSALGHITMLSNGASKITASMASNQGVFDSILVDVVVSAPMESRVVVEPSQSCGILQGDSQIFTVYRYVDGVKKPGAFTFTGFVKSGNYKYSVIDGNSFSIKNISMQPEPILVQCTGVDVSQVITISLKGAW